MILGTFTRAELLKTFHKIADVFEERAHGFCNYNQKAILKRLKGSGEYTKVFSCEIDGQRYYETFHFFSSKEGIDGKRLSIVTVFKDAKGTFVLAHNPNPSPVDDVYYKSSMELKLFSSHYIDRFFERTGKDVFGRSLEEKVMLILSENQPLSVATVDDSVIRRYGEPSLPYTFLREGKKEIECVYINDGDIAIVERYGLVPVWRTFIPKEMLFESQREYVDRDDIQEGIQTAKDFSNKLNGIK